MMHLDFDWEQFEEFLPSWEQLSVNGREVFLEWVDPIPNELHLLGEAKTELAELGLIHELTDGQRYRLPEEYRAIRRALRAMLRQTIFETEDDYSHYGLMPYIREHLTNAETMRIGSAYRDSRNKAIEVVSTASYLERFLEVQDSKQWELTINRQYYGEPFEWPEGQFEKCQILVKRLLEIECPVFFSDLLKVLDAPAADLLSGIYCGSHEMVLFVDLCPETYSPRVGILPQILDWINRPKNKFPELVVAEESFGEPFLLNDISRLVPMCAIEPIRLKLNGGALFAKAEKELNKLMIPQPPWLDYEFEAYRMIRSGRAKGFAVSMGLLTEQNSGGRNGLPFLKITSEGRKWLQLSETKQIEYLLSKFGFLTEDSSGLMKPCTWPFKLFQGCFGFGYLAFLDEVDDWWTSLIENMFGALVELAKISRDSYVDFGEFVQYVSINYNPFFGEDSDELCEFFFPRYGSRKISDEDLEAIWGRGFARFLMDRALPLGLITVGTNFNEPTDHLGDFLGLDLCGLPEGQSPVNTLIQVSELGRFCLGKSDDFALNNDTAAEVIIQPNFDVVFLSPGNSAEMKLMTLAERTGTGTGALFRLTKASIMKAAAGGLTADEVCSVLTEVSSKPVPKNVEREVRGWLAQACVLQWRPALVVDCPDKATAMRLVGEAGKIAVMLADNKVELTVPKITSALLKKLQKAGLFLQEFES